MIIHNVEQGTDDWQQLRLGIPTASEFHRILTPTGKLSAQAHDYLCRLVAERILGVPFEAPTTAIMQAGADLEAEAAGWYSFDRNVEVVKVGFITNDEGTIGCSPDRLVGDDGMLEIKCPLPHTHVGYMLTREIGQVYKPQIQAQMWLAERKWVDMLSYCVGLPKLVIRIERDEEYIDRLATEVTKFAAAVEEAYRSVKNEMPPPSSVPLDEDGWFDVTDADVTAILERR